MSKKFWAAFLIIYIGVMGSITYIGLPEHISPLFLATPSKCWVYAGEDVLVTTQAFLEESVRGPRGLISVTNATLQPLFEGENPIVGSIGAGGSYGINRLTVTFQAANGTIQTVYRVANTFVKEMVVNIPSVPISEILSVEAAVYSYYNNYLFLYGVAIIIVWCLGWLPSFFLVAAIEDKIGPWWWRFNRERQERQRRGQLQQELGRPPQEEDQEPQPDYSRSSDVSTLTRVIESQKKRIEDLEALVKAKEDVIMELRRWTREYPRQSAIIRQHHNNEERDDAPD